MQERPRQTAGVTDPALFLVDEATSLLLYADEPGLATLGWPAEELARLGLLDITARSSRPALATRLERLGRDEAGNGELGLNLLRRDGTEHPVRARLQRIRLPDRTLVAMIVLEDRGADAADREHATDAGLSERAFGDFVARLGHDMNNLLSTIIGSLGLLRDEPHDPAERENTKQLLDDALSAGHECADLVNRLLAAAGKQAVRPRPIQVNDIVGGLARLLGRTLPATIELEVDLAPELPQVTADPDALESALLDVAVNAREAMPEGGKLRIETRVSEPGEPARPALPEDAAFVEVSLTDEGCGIPEELRRRVLEPLFSTKRSGAGRGLGLSVAKGFARQSAGALHIESSPGNGTRVRLFLPT